MDGYSYDGSDGWKDIVAMAWCIAEYTSCRKDLEMSDWVHTWSFGSKI